MAKISQIEEFTVAQRTKVKVRGKMLAQAA